MIYLGHMDNFGVINPKNVLYHFKAECKDGRCLLNCVYLNAAPVSDEA